MTTASIRALWAEHQAAEFPHELAGEEVEGTDLVLLDADIAGCVDTFLADGAPLDPQRLAILGLCYRDASRAVLTLSSPARDHYARLEALARQVLEAHANAAPAS